MLKQHGSLTILIADKDLMGGRLPRWYGFAYRYYESRYTVLAVIPLNIIIRYTMKLYWAFYTFVKRDGWHIKLDDAYWRGFNDGNIEREHHLARLYESIVKGVKGDTNA